MKEFLDPHKCAIMGRNPDKWLWFGVQTPAPDFIGIIFVKIGLLQRKTKNKFNRVCVVYVGDEMVTNLECNF